MTPLEQTIYQQWDIPALTNELRAQGWMKTEPNRIDRLLWIGSYEALRKLASDASSEEEWSLAVEEGLEDEIVDEYMEGMAKAVMEAMGGELRREHVYAIFEEGEAFIGQYEDIAAEDLREMGFEISGATLSGANMGAVEGWVVTRDGETIAHGFANDGKAMKWIHDHQSGSVDYAVRHGGYDIVLVRGGNVEWSYRRDILPQSTELSAVELIELGAGTPEDFYADYDLGSKARMKGVLPEGEEAFFTRLESVWGDPKE